MTNRYVRLTLAGIVLAALLGGAFVFGRTDEARARKEAGATLLPQHERPLRTVSAADSNVTLSLLSVRRAGRTVIVRGRIAATKSARTDVLGNLALELGEDLGDAQLIDEPTGRASLPIKTGDGECRCTNGLDHVGPGDAIEVSAQFPAPTPSQSQLAFQVAGFPSIDGIRLP